jgi:Predicted membrane protein
MTGFLEIVLIAMTAQLAVLPGEKVQFLIAGLATRYSPVVVVSAAGAAFAIWTAVEVWFGGAIQGLLPPLVLDIITAVMFLIFAVLLVRSAPDSGADPFGTDGGLNFIEEYRLPVIGEVPSRFGGFLPIFAMMAAGEFGDKTQLVTISLALQYGATPGIWVGEMLVIIPVSIANAVFFHRFSGRFDVRKAHLAGASMFGFFAADTVLAVVTGFSLWETGMNAIGAILTALM